MKRLAAVCLIILLIMLSFLLGWRLMPRIWPDIKEAVVYPVLPQMRPSPAPSVPLYVPESNTSFGDPILANDSLVYYFYKDYCGYCMELSPLISGLPEEIILQDGTVSRVRLIALNKVEDEAYEIINDYYEAHNVAEDRRYVPALVVGDRYLFLRDEIIDQLMDALIHGEGLNTQLLDGAERIQETAH